MAPVTHGLEYVIESLEAALLSFLASNSLDEAILTAANPGDDSNTKAAICVQRSGAYVNFP
jgi:ADP-ribosyl-[dinitrogen reductase] hydrolase